MISRKALRIAWREYLATVRTKGFLLGLILMPIFMSGSAIAMALLKGTVDTRDKRVAIVDRSGIVARALMEAAEARNAREVLDRETGKKVKPAYLFEEVPPDEQDPRAQRLELSNRVREGRLHAFVEIGPDILHPGKNRETSRILYHSERGALDDLRGWMDQPINEHLRKLRLAEAGISESVSRDLFAWVHAEGLGLVSVDEATGQVQEAQRTRMEEAVLVPMILVILMFMLVMFGATPLLQSVMEEKMQRIAEVLLGCVRPFEFLMGKILGGIGVSLTGSAVYVIGGIIALIHLDLGKYVPYELLPWFFTYMILLIIMLGSMLAALGSACNEPKEAQSLMPLAILPVIIPLFVGMPVMKEPLSNFATGMSLFPPFTPVLMLLRQGTPGGIPPWQPWVGLAGMVICTIISVWAAGRIFRVGILIQGQPPRLSTLVRWAIRG